MPDERQPTVAATRRVTTIGAELGDWIALLKPRVMTLVVFTGLIGLLIAPGHLHPVLAFTAVLCIAVGRRRVRRDQHVVRPRHRRGDAAHAQPADPGRPHRAGRGAGLWRHAGGRVGAS